MAMAAAHVPSIAVLLLLVAPPELSASTAAEDAAVAAENEQLRSRLKVLENRLEEERQYSYVRANGYVSSTETIYEETMEVAEAKQWCNANAECKGFTFLAPAEGDEEEEVTITFKGSPEAGTALKVDADPSMVSYIKATAAEGIFGSIGDAAMQLSGADGQAVVSHWLSFQGACLLLVGGVAAAFCRQRMCGRAAVAGRAANPLLPLSEKT